MLMPCYPRCWCRAVLNVHALLSSMFTPVTSTHAAISSCHVASRNGKHLYINMPEHHLWYAEPGCLMNSKYPHSWCSGGIAPCKVAQACYFVIAHRARHIRDATGSHKVSWGMRLSRFHVPFHNTLTCASLLQDGRCTQVRLCIRPREVAVHEGPLPPSLRFLHHSSMGTLQRE